MSGDNESSHPRLCDRERGIHTRQVMDKLKTYAIPLVGLVVLLAYWFVVRPMLAEQAVVEPSSTKGSPNSK